MILVDTGFWIALANAKDPIHARAVSIFSTLEEPLITTWPVLTETTHILLSRMGTPMMVSFLTKILSGAVEVFEIGMSHREKICTLMKKYSDLPMDMADASLVILADDIHEGRILSTDMRDFKAYRWKNRNPFKNLLIE